MSRILRFSRRAFYIAAPLSVGSGLTFLWYEKGPIQFRGPTVKSTLPLEHMQQITYATKSETEKVAKTIKNIVGEENVSSNVNDLMSHADSPFQFHHPSPDEYGSFVVYPHSIEEVSQVVKLCNEHRVPITPYSGGTSLEGHYIPMKNGISLDLSRMNKILKLNTEDLDVVVQPGVTWEEINEEGAKVGLRFGPDPGPSAMIGGMVGTNASGTNAMAMGTMRQNVIGLKVVLADGTIVQTRRRPRKSSAGYSLTDLFVGSEGTLGIIVEATVKLHPIPKYTVVGAVSFPSIRDAASLVESVLQEGYKLDAMELIDDGLMRLINLSGITSRHWKEQNTILLRFAGPSKDQVDREIAAISALSKLHKASSFVTARNQEEGNDLWAARKNALFSILNSVPQGYKVLGTDTAVPISQLSRVVDESHEKLKEMRLIGCVLGHVGDGNLHVCLAYNPDSDDVAKVHTFAKWIANLCISLEGTCTGEHGIGLGKRSLLKEELGLPSIDLMRQIKKSLDPQLIFNPGKIFSVHPDDIGEDFTTATESHESIH